MEKELNFKEIVNYIKDVLKNDNLDWERAIFLISFSSDNSQGYKFRFYYKDKEYKKKLDVFEYDPILSKIFEDIEHNKIIRNYNRIVITIEKENYEVTYEMDDEEVKKELQSTARIFPNFLYERIRTQIFEYEIENKLLIPIYDEDEGLEILAYESSWDHGLFTFIINVNTQEIAYTVELFKEGVKRIVPLTINKELKEGILYHHELTHGTLKENWQPWNKIVLTAPEQFIPLGKDQDYIEYSLVDISNTIL